jgi:GntR family transcriptional repressor for pyruvate dehydrogenase complex
MANFRPVKAKKIYEEIMGQIMNLISDGGLKPGDKLPSERELSEALDVSRASVREALRALEMKGFLEIRSGEGTFIRESSNDFLVEPLTMLLHLEDGAFHEVYEVRKTLETSCAYLAALRATTEDIKQMDDALNQMERDISTNNLGQDADTKFHYAIAEATHNSLLQKLMNTIGDSIRNTVTHAREKLYKTPGNPNKLLQQHRAIFEAIRLRRADQARDLMQMHLDFSEQEMIKNS